jgi:hypothetical protein
MMSCDARVPLNSHRITRLRQGAPGTCGTGQPMPGLSPQAKGHGEAVQISMTGVGLLGPVSACPSGVARG